MATSEVVTARTMDGAEEAVETMREHAIRRLPVVDDDGKPVGIVSLGDLAERLDHDSALAQISKAPPNR
jgi:CBS domain-containing protein